MKYAWLLLYFHLVNVYGEHEDLYSTSTPCGIRGARDNGFRIVNGSLASKGEFPWLISLQVRIGFEYRHICGGAILSESWVATAAHCLNGILPSSLYVVAGDYNLQIIEGGEQAARVSKAVTNKFDLSTFANDICLLKLETPLQFTEGSRVMPICLPKNFQEFQGDAIVAGWGRSSETDAPTDLLRYIEIPLRTKTSCDESYIRKGFSRLLNNCQICAGLPEGGKDACQGDSGGPLICQTGEKYVLCGIVSWGIGCGRQEFPGIYTKVSCFVEWIRKTVLEQ
ncbi:hypothetical protein HHI36_006709 [Cryptolaemus montrouzieri]|uniref:Phenoloxidase-activating factor 2 n=1 Tax=Cryptolaemus montrouzieri TaxID=559131 RepID=A0ABD2NY66_9CUCU